MVCYEVQVEPALQPITAKTLLEGLIKPLMEVLKSNVGVPGSDRGLHSSI